ncbi:MAG: methyltransferase domain-containing protein [Arenicellales bacterium]|jgi:SAM-dependent methyltransferase|nr:methyltransferase domain-containing protein [Arenicellales bacterium]
MISNDIKEITDHYTQGTVLDAIKNGLASLGKSAENVTLEDLGPVDEFHIGGREATGEFLDQLTLSADDHVLDVGCGIGGAARFAAERYGSAVTGLDLTAEYIETGQVLCAWVGLADRITFQQGSGTNMPFADHSFDKAYMMHVGMNIADKVALVGQLHRVLKPGGRLGIYDVMRVGDGDLTFPLPWSSLPETSALSRPEEYKDALKGAGFQLVAERNRRIYAMAFFTQLRASMASADGPPPLGLHILMGDTTPQKIKNVAAHITENRIAPVELIAEKPY